jgi:hypothetical protein
LFFERALREKSYRILVLRDFGALAVQQLYQRRATLSQLRRSSDVTQRPRQEKRLKPGAWPGLPPQAHTCLATVMFQSPRTYLRRLLVNYGEHFCLLLCSVYGGLKGPVFQMITSAQLPYFKSIGITGQQYQSYGTVASTPWAMKAAIGITSDAVPLWGWHKRPYMLIGSGSCHPSCYVPQLS